MYQSTFEEPWAIPSKITESLWVGPQPPWIDSSSGVPACSLIIQLCGDYKDSKKSPLNPAALVLKFEIKDKPSKEASGLDLRKLKMLVEVLSKALEHHTVYLHCACGVSRSGVVLVAWLMAKRRCSMQAATEEAQQLRPCLFSVENEYFQEVLKEFETEMFRQPNKT